MSRFRLILDANFLLLPFQFNINLFDEFDRILGEYQAYTLDRTLGEATSIEKGKYSSLVKKLIDKKPIEIISKKNESNESVDDLLFELGTRGYIICTNDKGLKKKLNNRDLPVISMRNKTHLESKNLRTRFL